MEVSSQLHALGALPEERTLVCVDGKLVLLLLGFEIQTMQPIAAAIPLSQLPRTYIYIALMCVTLLLTSFCVI